MPTADDPRITVRLYPALKAALDVRAARTGRSVGSIVTEACESLLAADVSELLGVPVPEAAEHGGRALEAALGFPGGAGVAGPVTSLGEPVEVRQAVVDRASPASPRAPEVKITELDPTDVPGPHPGDDFGIVEAEFRPSVQQLAGRNGATQSVARRWLETGEWRRYWK